MASIPYVGPQVDRCSRTAQLRRKALDLRDINLKLSRVSGIATRCHRERTRDAAGTRTPGGQLGGRTLLPREPASTLAAR